MKKKICTRLLHFTATALLCAAFLSGIPSNVETEKLNNGSTATEVHDEASAAKNDTAKHNENSVSEDVGIQPQENWEENTLKK